MDSILLPLLILLLLARAYWQSACKAKTRSRKSGRAARRAWVTTVTFAASLLLWFQFERGSASFRFLTSLPLLGSETLALRLGVDGISVLLILLSTLLTPLCILASWSSIKTRVRAYMIAFLLLESLMIGTFAALDLFLFYLFFEAVLIPMFLIIGIWGGKNRVYAAYKFFLYTLAGSVLMLVALFVIFARSGTADLTGTGAGCGARPAALGFANLALASAFCVLCGQNTHVALSYLATRRSCRGATAGSVILASAAENGRLRLSASIIPIFAAGVRAAGTARFCAVDYCCGLHLAGGAGAAGHKEAHRLLFGRAYGLCDGGDFLLPRKGWRWTVPDA